MPRPTEGTKEAIAAISSLKRALGIANHPTKRDEFQRDDLGNDVCHIYTPDAESAELMGELLYRTAIMPRGAAFYDSLRPRRSERDTIKVQPLEEGGYEASMIAWGDIGVLTRKLQKMVEKHVSPDKSGGRQK